MISAFKHMGLSIKNLTHGVRHPRQVTQVVVLALYDIAISEGVDLSNEIGEKLYSILSAPHPVRNGSVGYKGAMHWYNCG